MPKPFTPFLLSLYLFVAGAEELREGPKSVDPSDLNLGRMVENIRFSPATGKRFQLADLKSPCVVAFVSTSCPVSKRYAPTLAALEKEFAPRGVKFVFVNPIASDARDNSFSGAYVMDDRRKISSTLGARSTAEVFVLDAARTLIYRGAIDDQYGLGYSRDTAKEHFLSDALEAVLAGRMPAIQATTAPGCLLESSAPQKVVAKAPTYYAQISRSIQSHCLECHRAGGVAPFSLETYKDVLSHAGMIRKQVEKGAMPPWFAEPAPHGFWSNDRSIPAAEKSELIAWLNGNRKEGDPMDAPLPRHFPTDWQIGEPDAIVKIPTPIEVKATGTMPYQLVFVDTDFGEDRWVSAIEVRPTAREVVHHALIHVIPRDKAARARERRGGASNGDGFFAVYVPGNNVLQFPDGFAKLIPAGATLRFQIHYTPNGTATRDQTAVGLRFSKTKPLHEVRVSAVVAKLDIRPGDANYEVHGTLPVPFNARLMSFMPHMHVRGKAYKYELKLPNGEIKPLLSVPRYDFNWQLQYKLAEVVDAPAGSALLGTAWYDNSANNPANPDPTERVRWGEQTYEEMMLGYVEYYIPSVAPGASQPSIIEMAMRDGGAVFNSLDKNRDGKITANESPSAREFADADANGDGEVTREEFSAYWKRKSEKAKARE